MESVLRRFVLLSVLIDACGIQAGVQITGVTIDNTPLTQARLQDVAGDALQPLRIRDSVRELVFRFAEVPFVGSPAARLRYKLEGYDKSWTDLPMKMRMLVRFWDDDPKVIGQHEFALEGETPGWSGDPETSNFVLRRERIVVPEHARTVRLGFVSHGGDIGIGIVAIDAVRSVIEPAAGGDWKTNDLTVSAVPPAKWMREGSLLEIARLGKRASPVSHPILILEDNNALNYGNWSLTAACCVSVQPGDRLTVEWQTAHSIGSSGPGEAHYGALRPGNYVFRVSAFQPNGEATGVECALPVIVFPAIYRRVDFWLVLAAFAAAIAALAGRMVEVGRARRRVTAMEHERMLERERARIARDLHDEMGSGLSAIAMQGDWIRRECGVTASPETRHRIETVCQSAVELVRSVDEIVWAVNPSNDTVERFVNYLTQYTEQYLDTAGLRFRFDIPVELPVALLAGSMRHNLFLAVKEALHNVVKHAQAELLWLRVSAGGNTLIITVEDNGKGFDSVKLAVDGTHNGLGNMRRRMEEVAGRFDYWSQPDKGTRMTFAVPLAAAVHEV